MNDLLKLTNEMVSNINNTSNVTNIQNSNWKSPVQNQEDKLEQIHQQFLKAQEWGNNLNKKNSSEISENFKTLKIKNKRDTSGIVIGEGIRQHNQREKDKREFPQRETNFIVSLDPKISLLGSDDQERGVLWLDTSAKRIKFYLRKNYNGSDHGGKFDTYKNIIIRDKNNNVVRIVTFNIGDLMSNVLRAHNLLNNNDGLGYEDGYTIEITSSQANKTKFKKNINNDWVWNTSNGQHTEKFTIIGNRMWELNVFQETFFKPLITWKWAYDHQESWKKNVPDNIRWQISQLVTAIDTVKNSLAIQEIKDELSSLKDEIKNLKEAVAKLASNAGINGLSACSSTIGAIKNVHTVAKFAFSWIPVLGPTISSALDLTNSACSLANAYGGGRKRRDVSTVENKFDDNFIKLVNQEQHLPSINNQTNFVTNNTTSL